MIGCTCEDCEGGCDQYAEEPGYDLDGEALCYDCSHGLHRQDRDGG